VLLPCKGCTTCIPVGKYVFQGAYLVPLPRAVNSSLIVATYLPYLGRYLSFASRNHIRMDSIHSHRKSRDFVFA